MAVSIREKIEATRVRWNLKAPDPGQLERAFRNRLTRTLGKAHVENANWVGRIVQDAHFALGLEGSPPAGWLPHVAQHGDVRELALVLQTCIDTESELFKKRDPIIQLLKGAPNTIVQAVRAAVETSPGAPFEVAVGNDGLAVLYPAGAPLLDEKVVDATLQWLGEFPDVLTHFEKALRTYLQDGAAKRRNILDDVRLALEQLLRKILGNEKSLENQKEALGAWLRDRGLHANVIGMFHSLLFGAYAPYQNDAVKHDDASHPEEVEFILYLTANFMRLLLQARRASLAAGKR